MGDGELVERLRAGDEAAFVDVVRRHGPQLRRLAYGLVGSAAVADEIVQDTWLALVRGVDRFEGRSSLKTWLFRVLVNRARSAGAREQRAGRPQRDEDLSERFDASGEWVVPPVPWAELIDDRLAAERLAARVRELLPLLPETQGQVVTLRDVEGLPAPEVSAVLGITDGNQRVLLHRGRSQLRGLLEAEAGSW